MLRMHSLNKGLEHNELQGLLPTQKVVSKS